MRQIAIILIALLFSITKIQSQNLLPVGTGVPAPYGIHAGTVSCNNEIYAADNWQIYKWNGSSWASMGVTVDYAIICMTVHNNELYVGGWFEHFNGNPVNRIIKYDGINWQPVGAGIFVPSNVTGGVEKMISFNGKLIALGGFTGAGSVNANQIASWDGVVWDTLGSGITGLSSIPSMCVFNNKLYVFSQISNAGGVPVQNAAMWNGSNWFALGNGINGWPVSSIGYDNCIYVGLWIGQGNPSSMIIKWDGVSWTNVEQNLNNTSWNIALDLIEFNGCLYTAGLIDVIDGVATSNIARYDGTAWHPVANGVNGFGYFFTVLNNELYLTGDFTNSGPTIVNYIVKFDQPPFCVTSVNEQNNKEEDIAVYPSPVLEVLYIEKRFQNSETSSYKIMDAFGRVVMENKNIPGSINVGSLVNGFYFIQFENDGNVETKKFIKN